MKVRNMTSNSGNTIANQFIIEMGNGTVFQSYDSIIAFKPKGSTKVYLGKNWSYSRTTMKYLNKFLGTDSIGEVRECIKSGHFILKDLDNPKKEYKEGMMLRQVTAGNLGSSDFEARRHRIHYVHDVRERDSNGEVTLFLEILDDEGNRDRLGSYSDKYINEHYKEIK